MLEEVYLRIYNIWILKLLVGFFTLVSLVLSVLMLMVEMEPNISLVPLSYIDILLHQGMPSIA